MKSKSYLITSIVLALISLVSATILTLEKIELWKNPNYIPSCSWNPLFSCQGPMNSWQSSLFVVPNPIIGMVGFSLVILISFTALFVKLPKWYWTLHLIGVTLAFSLIAWLITQSFYDIKALCIYCMIVWTCMIPLFWLTLSSYIKQYYPESKLAFINRVKVPLIVATYLAVILMMYIQFQSFFNFLLGLS
jgi:uncharacterized membrane protein